MKKVYQKKDQFSNLSSLRITVNGKSQTVVFENKRKNGILTCETSDEAVQKGIEDSRQFKEGKIVCIEGATEKAPATTTKTDFQPAEYPEVTTFAQAKEVLTGEPYKVGKTSNSLKSVEGIHAKAAELGISFPNLPTEE